MKPKDQTKILEGFENAIAPIVSQIESRMARLGSASSKAMPYMLEEIQVLSDALISIEIVFGQILSDYIELTDGYHYQRRQIETLQSSLHWYINELEKETQLSNQRYFERIQKQIEHETDGRPQPSA